MIAKTLAAAFPSIPVFGERGHGPAATTAPARWVVDPIDGTVNFAHGIPHAAVSIALQLRESPRTAGYADGYATVVGVVFDTVLPGTLHRSKRPSPPAEWAPDPVSSRPLAEAILSLGFSGRPGSIPAMVRDVRQLSSRVRKLRMMGSAALALAYVAAGRFDAYVERGIHLWDIAAGRLIVEAAGGEFHRKELGTDGRIALTASNRRVGRALRKSSA